MDVNKNQSGICVTMTTLNKTIRYYREYLSYIETLAKPMSDEQKEQLNQILSAQLTLLVALKRDSKLGGFSINWVLKLSTQS